MRPILAVPVGDSLRCLGLALYGPHATGNALSHEERSMLAELADKAASVFMQINDDQLRRRITTLERELATIAERLLRPVRPLWVISRLFAVQSPCPLYPRKRTSAGVTRMSAKSPLPSLRLQKLPTELKYQNVAELASQLGACP